MREGPGGVKTFFFLLASSSFSLLQHPAKKKGGGKKRAELQLLHGTVGGITFCCTFVRVQWSSAPGVCLPACVCACVRARVHVQAKSGCCSRSSSKDPTEYI